MFKLRSLIALAVASIACTSSVFGEVEANDVVEESSTMYAALSNAKDGHAEEFVTPSTDSAFFSETFQETEIFADNKWIKSTVAKYASQSIAFKKMWSNVAELAGDQSLVLDQAAKHYGISRRLVHPFEITKEKDSLVVQYEVKLSESLACGGAYIKLLSDTADLNLSEMDDQTPFSIMFGPDKCGSDNKVHFIIRYENPVSHVWEEKTFKKSSFN